VAPLVYVTGHRNPDLDSIGSAIGYAELKQRLRSGERYVPVRLGPVNAQTRWALERSGVEEPELLPHIHLRVCDVMRKCPLTVRRDAPVRDVGHAMAEERVDVVAVTDEAGALSGVVTERDLARMYIRESRGASTFEDRPVRLAAINEVLGGRIVTGEDREVSGRLWVVAVEIDSMDDRIGPGDIAVVGDRPDAQRRALEIGAAVLVTSHDTEPSEEVVALARERDAAVVVSPLDSYVSGRMIQLAVPCETIMSCDPLTAAPEDLLAEVAGRIGDVEYRAAMAVDEDGAPVGIVSHSDLVNPQPRRVLLVDHAEQAQSVPGIEGAEIVEILDHHHIGSIETRIPVKATFDPVGSTATLVVERFRREGREPRRPTATMLLAALLSDTVVLTSPTATDRDHRVVEYLEELLELDARAFGMEMFEASSDASELDAAEIVGRDAKEYATAAGHTIAIAQFETVGTGLRERKDELLEALEGERGKHGYALSALMITDIVSRGTELLVAGDTAPVERAFGVRARDSTLELPGVMSRKKQVAPKLLAHA
jgi:manganese-dependent inorganic pyrophosphatase